MLSGISVFPYSTTCSTAFMKLLLLVTILSLWEKKLLEIK